MTIPYGGPDLDEQGHPVDSLLKAMVNAAWLDRQVFPPLEELVPEIVTEGFGVLVGPPKAGKSWLVADLALACASGGFALGKVRVKQRPVLYLALEDGHRRLQSRFRVVNCGGPLPATLDVLTTIAHGQVVPTIAEWVERHRKSAPLVILDTLGKARPQRRPGDDPYLADYQAGGALKAIVDAVPGAGLIAVHHTRKAESADFVDAVSGTAGIAGAADYILVLARKRQSEEAVLSVTGRDVAEKEVALRTESGRWSLEGVDVSAAMRTVQARKDQGKFGDRTLDALAFVNSRGGVTPMELAGHLGIENKHASTYLTRLVDAGSIRKAGRGRYEPMEVGVETVESVESEGPETGQQSVISTDSTVSTPSLQPTRRVS